MTSISLLLDCCCSQHKPPSSAYLHRGLLTVALYKTGQEKKKDVEVIPE